MKAYITEVVLYDEELDLYAGKIIASDGGFSVTIKDKFKNFVTVEEVIFITELLKKLYKDNSI